MIQIVKPTDIIWKQIDNNSLVSECLEKINILLSECTEMKYNSVTLVIDLPYQLGNEDTKLITLALKLSGWAMTSSFKYSEKIKKFFYSYILTPMVK